MNEILMALTCLILVTSCNEQKSKSHSGTAANKTEENIYRCGDSMLAAFKRKDWMTFVKYNNPNMTKRMGGTAAFASFINEQMKQIPDTAIKNISLGEILQVVKTPSDVQCVVEQNMLLQLDGTNLNKTTYLVGESLDNGTNWTFFDASTKTLLAPKDIKTNISNELKIPVAKKMFNKNAPI